MAGRRQKISPDVCLMPTDRQAVNIPCQPADGEAEYDDEKQRPVGVEAHIVETLGVQNFSEQEAIYLEEIDRLNKLFQYLVLLSK